MTTDDVVAVIGAGGHGKVVLDALVSLGVVVWGIADDNPDLLGTRVLDVPVMCTVESLDRSVTRVAHGVGSSRARQLLASGISVPAMVVVHLSAVVSRHAHLAEGVVILAGAVVQPDAHVGNGAIVNTGAVIEHDCRVGAFSHVAPNATVTGGAHVGRGSFIGPGAVVLPGVTVGDGATVRAGAVVVVDVAADTTVAGVPARPTGTT